MERVIQLIIEADGDYCGKGEMRPSCPNYQGHSGMIQFHHNCLAYNHGLMGENYTNDEGVFCSSILRCAECLAFDQGEATTEMLEKLEVARAVQEFRRGRGEAAK